MGLKVKAIITMNAIVIVACVVMGIIGYLRAEEGFARALQMKAVANVQSLSEILNYKYAGDWSIKDGVLYKGEEQIDGNNDLAESLSRVCNGKVTFFNGDTRVATTVKDASGNRAVGIKASDAVIENVLKQGKNFVGAANVMGEEHYAAYQPLKDSSGKTIGMFFVGLSVHEMDDVVRDLFYSILIALVGIMILCVPVSNFFVGKMIAQLEGIVGTMKKISSGNLRIPDMTIKTRDEMGALAEGLNDMKIRLKNLLTKIAECSERVAASSEELTAGTHQTNESIIVVARSMEMLTNDTAEQEKTIQSLEEKFQALSDRMDGLSETALKMEQIATDSATNANIGSEKVDVAIDMMKNIEQQVNSASEVIGELGKRSDEIGQIVKTISDIADRTNLLALNAAIEASHAGEHGRGFAVVAEEVRKLAEQSSTATASIAKLIATIQKDTASAVEAIERGNKCVAEGTQSVSETGEAFVGIKEQSTKLTESVEKTLGDVGEAFMSTQEIFTAIKKVREIASESRENSCSVSAATQQQTATMQEVTHASKVLAELANEMQGEVSQFKL